MHLHPNTEQEKIQQLREWCDHNAHSGARPMLAWRDQDFREILRNGGNSYQQALAQLKRIAAVYSTGLASAAGYQAVTL